MKKYSLVFFYVFSLCSFSAFSNPIPNSDSASNCHGLINFFETATAMTDQVARIEKYFPNGIAYPTQQSEVQEIVEFANKHNLKLSIKTGGFSQGGQWAITNGIVLDLSNYKGIKINNIEGTVTAKVGSTWKEIQALANAEDFALTVQQSSNIFNPGGALGMNIHGRDIQYGAIINVTNWIDVLLPDGQIIRATKNNEYATLFKKVIGGLGLRGVILQANFQLRPNKIYETIILRDIPSHQIAHVFDLMRSNPKKLKKYISQEDLGKITTDFATLKSSQIGMGYGRAHNLNPTKPGYLDKALFYMFVEVAKNKISPDAQTTLKTKKRTIEYFMPLLMELQRWSHSVKDMREWLEKKFMRGSGRQSSLNYLMDPPVDFLLFKQKEEVNNISTKVLNFFKKTMRRIFNVPVASTDVLKEYFIPLRNVEQFKKSLVKVIQKYNLNNLNITYRIVPKTPAALAPLINYAKEDTVAFVINFNVGLAARERAQLDVWSEELVQAAIKAEGMHYLAYEPNATLEQFLTAYPGFIEIFDEMIAENSTLFMNEYIRSYFSEYLLNPSKFKVR